jgi:hypothetical protein
VSKMSNQKVIETHHNRVTEIYSSKMHVIIIYIFNRACDFCVYFLKLNTFEYIMHVILIYIVAFHDFINLHVLQMNWIISS